MPVAITCPHCDRRLRLPEGLYERPAECPLCGGAFVVRWRKHDPAPDEERVPCRFCGQPLRREALKCPSCRRWMNTEG